MPHDDPPRLIVINYAVRILERVSLLLFFGGEISDVGGHTKVMRYEGGAMVG